MISYLYRSFAPQGEIGREIKAEAHSGASRGSRDLDRGNRCDRFCPALYAAPAAACPARYRPNSAPTRSTPAKSANAASPARRGCGTGRHRRCRRLESATVLIARGDTILYRRARGMAETELGVPMAPDQIFRIASITKSFTAALIVQMAERGEVALDASAVRYLLRAAARSAHHAAPAAKPHRRNRGNDATPQPPFGPGEVPLAQQVARIAARPLRSAPGHRAALFQLGLYAARRRDRGK